MDILNHNRLIQRTTRRYAKKCWYACLAKRYVPLDLRVVLKIYTGQSIQTSNCDAGSHPAGLACGTAGTQSPAAALVDLLVNLGNLANPHLALFVLHIKDIVYRPVEVVCDIRYLLIQLIQGVA